MMKTTKDTMVSVVIPVYNGEKYLKETVKSVMDQSYSKFELIIVDDGSTDQTREICKTFTDSRIHVIRIDNNGVSNARNVGFARSVGDYLAFLDADDIWVENNLELKVAYLDANQQVGLVHSDGLTFSEKTSFSESQIVGKEGEILNEILQWNGTSIHAPSSILVRRSVIEKVGGFERRLSTAADQEFYFRVANAYEVGRVPTVTWHYRIHDNNMHQNIGRMERDHLLAYQLAEQSDLFKSQSFRNHCFSNLYMILGASWWSDGKNKVRGLKFFCKAIAIHPPNIVSFIKKLWRKIF